MLHDPVLTDKLSSYSSIEFSGFVYRVTANNAEPCAASSNGGRWALPERDGLTIPILYTSLEPEGALAEVASYLALLTPIPQKQLMLHTIEVSTSNSLKLLEVDLCALGVDMEHYQEREYLTTQKIGAALNFLGFDGLIAPSARWECDNLMLYTDNHELEHKLDVTCSKEKDWFSWAQQQGIIEAAI